MLLLWCTDSNSLLKVPSQQGCSCSCDVLYHPSHMHPDTHTIGRTVLHMHACMCQVWESSNEDGSIQPPETTMSRARPPEVTLTSLQHTHHTIHTHNHAYSHIHTYPYSYHSYSVSTPAHHTHHHTSSHTPPPHHMYSPVHSQVHTHVDPPDPSHMHPDTHTPGHSRTHTHTRVCILWTSSCIPNTPPTAYTPMSRARPPEVTLTSPQHTQDMTCYIHHTFKPDHHEAFHIHICHAHHDSYYESSYSYIYTSNHLSHTLSLRLHTSHKYTEV